MSLGLFQARLAIKYIFFEMLPSFMLGIIFFIFVLLMFQALRLTEFILVHGAEPQIVMRMMAYLSISFMPVILPMSLIFSILLTYGRLSGDSEIIALRALGLNFTQISFPALLLAVITATVSAQTAFQVGPWGNRQFELLIGRLDNIRAAATIKEGVFSEGLFNLVVYANKVQPDTGQLEQLFIYDERDPKVPLTIIAQSGVLVQNQDVHEISAALRLSNGNILRHSAPAYTKISFKIFDINLSDPIQRSTPDKSILSLTLGEIRQSLKNEHLEPGRRIKLEMEFHKRWAIALACPLFALLGVGFGTVTSRRSGKSSGIVVCVIMIVLYWALYLICENLAKNNTLPPAVAAWATNTLFAAVAVWSIYRLRKT